jgi:hypothetical protein
MPLKVVVLFRRVFSALALARDVGAAENEVDPFVNG